MSAHPPLIPKSDDEIISALRKQLERQHQQGAAIQGEQDYAKLFMAAIDQSSEAIFFTDEAGTIVYTNRAFLERSEFSKEEIIGKSPRLLKSGEHPPEFYQDMWKTLLSGQVFRSRINNRSKSGKILREEISISPVKDAKGVITNFVAIKTDIGRIVEKELQLEAANAELRRSNAELEQFAHAASHDLQEPLRSISSCLQLVMKKTEGQIDERSLGFMTRAVQAAARMRALIDSLLSLSRIKTFDSDPEETPLGNLVTAACENLASVIETTGAQIKVARLPIVAVNPPLVTQIFQNLISNAIKFQKPGCVPEVEIGAIPLKNGWRIHVSDNGIGIRPDFFKEIFGMFKRLHNLEEYPGTGIGLAICRKIVEKHGGTIGVESTPGMGTTFFFTLPDHTRS